jgi:hypothetical protein
MPSKKELVWLGIGVLVGIVFSQQIGKLPLVNKIPQL